MLTKQIDSIVKWLTENVCDKITLKVPDDYANDGDYTVRLVHPAAFPLFLPTKERLPPSAPAPIPSICVQLTEGNDELSEHLRTLQIRLCLACWNPGEHGKEFYQPRENPSAIGGFSYYLIDDEEEQAYTRNMEGWRDSMNFADIVLREIESAEYIGGMRVMKENGIRFGPFSEDGNIWDYYPYWNSWISFDLSAGIPSRSPAAYNHLL